MRGSPDECIAYLANCDPDNMFEVKLCRRQRTLTQNAYYWSMLSDLAAKLGMPNCEVHKQMLRDHGPFETFIISDFVPLDDYFAYYDIVRRVGDAFEVRVYKGSSHMSKQEFSRLIDGMIEECIAQEIYVMPKDKIARLRFVEPEGDSE